MTGERETGKARFPTAERLNGGTASWLEEADRSLCRDGTSMTWVKYDDRYAGALPFRPRYRNSRLTLGLHLHEPDPTCMYPYAILYLADGYDVILHVRVWVYMGLHPYKFTAR